MHFCHPAEDQGDGSEDGVEDDVDVAGVADGLIDDAEGVGGGLGGGMIDGGGTRGTAALRGIHGIAAVGAGEHADCWRFDEWFAHGESEDRG